MTKWHLEESDLKRYPHFDQFIGPADAEALATDPNCVATHTFYPFMLYNQRWTRFAEKGEKGKVKTRPIRYASRRDAYIFSYYRHVLSEKYEPELRRLSLEDCILAYRSIPTDNSKGGKCNIHFANDAFLRIREIGECAVISLDISSYFESLDHCRLKALWCRMIGGTYLPKNHLKVFNAITEYSVVDKQQVYERLGHFGEKRKSKFGKPINGYLSPYRKIPKQLCTGREFRQKIAGGDGTKSLILKNYKPYGIPQGAPISDLLANLYLIDFDTEVASWIQKAGGSYFRYSDDILVVVPGDESCGLSLMTQIRDFVREFGEKLEIKEEKSSLLTFERDGDDQRVISSLKHKDREGVEFLGFRYNGRKAYIRNRTLTSLNRKVVRAARRDANACARRYPDKCAAELRQLFNYERLIKAFGRVEEFGEKQREYRNWTFWTYAKRASVIFGPMGQPILRQLRRYRTFVQRKVDAELERAVARREKDKITP